MVGAVAARLVWARISNVVTLLFMESSIEAGKQMTSREFNQETGVAKTAAHRGPVFVTNRGRPTHVLLTYENYRLLVGGSASLLDLLGATPGAGEVDLPLPERIELAQPADFA